MDDLQGHLVDCFVRLGMLLDGSDANELTASIEAREAAGRGLPLVDLQQRAGLDRSAIDVLVALAAPSLDAELAGRLRERSLGAAPMVEELISMLGATPEGALAVRAALAPDAPLVANGIVELVGPDLAALQRTARIDDRVVEYLGGSRAIDRRLRGSVAVHEGAPAGTDASSVAALRRALGSAGPIVVDGPARVGKTTAVIAAAEEPIVVADLERIATGEEPVRMLVIARREALFAGARFAIRAGSWDDAWPLALRRSVIALVQDAHAILTIRDADPVCRMLRGPRRITVAMPSAAAQHAIWRSAIDGDAGDVCARYPLPPGDIVLAAAAARAAAELEHRAVTPADIATAARARIAHRLGDVAELVSTSLEWSDVILRDVVAARIREIVDAVKHRDRVMESWGFGDKLPYGRSTAALFAGPPGTGKTMVATLIGKQLGLEVFRVDVSRIVSKYIGETEKNLARVFEEATRCKAILLFDEADSLFAKRTEVKSSNDRYANLEVNFLLQRLESHDGIVILTTNAANAIDEAFMRRIRYRIEFPGPDDKEREQLWRSMIPAAAPLAGDVDFAALGRRFTLSGGHIKNAVMRAAYLAAAAGHQSLTQDVLVRAAVSEWTELGHLVEPAPAPVRGSEPELPAPAAIPRITPLGAVKSVGIAPASEQALLRLLAQGPRVGETIDGAFRRKEREIGELFARLSIVEARALHRRLTLGEQGDAVAAQFARMSLERRTRLLAFLGDARRRAAVTGRAS